MASDGPSRERRGSDTARLLMPVEDGRPTYRDRIEILDVNETYDGGLCLVEVPADEPNLAWVLQDPAVVRVGYDQPATERTGPPSDLLDPGRNGPPREASERRRYEPPDGPVDVAAPTVVPPERVDDESIEFHVASAAEGVDPPPWVEAALGEQFDLSAAIRKRAYGAIEGGGAPIVREEYYVFPRAALAVPTALEANEDYRGTGAVRKFERGIRNDLLGHGIEHLYINTVPDIVRGLNETGLHDGRYERVEGLPSPSENTHWYRRTEPLEG